MIRLGRTFFCTDPITLVDAQKGVSGGVKAASAVGVCVCKDVFSLPNTDANITHGQKTTRIFDARKKVITTTDSNAVVLAISRRKHDRRDG